MNEIEKYYSVRNSSQYKFRKLIYLYHSDKEECISVFRFINFHNHQDNMYYDTKNSFCTLFMFVRGYSNLIINGETFYATNGSIVAKSDIDIHRPYSYVTGEIEYYGINFPAEYIKKLKGSHFLYDMFYGTDRKSHTINNPKIFEDIIDSFERINRNQNENDLLLYAYVIELVHQIYDAIKKPVPKNSQSLIYDATNYMTSNFKTIETIDDIASYCNVSTSYLCRVFKNKLNCTVNDLLTNLRTENSIELLKRGYTVMDAAENSGFKNYQYYVTLFKKKYKTTPCKFITEIDKKLRTN